MHQAEHGLPGALLPSQGSKDLLRPFRTGDVAGATELSMRLSWPYRPQDWDFAHRLGQGVALEREGRLLGTGLWWAYGRADASFGMIIVAPDCQGMGLGARIFDALLDQAADRTIRLNSTAAGLELYRRRGFVETGRIHQHQGLAGGAAAREPRADIAPLKADDLPRLLALDTSAAGMPRTALLAELVRVGRTSVITRAGEIVGYAICRTFGRGQVIGPVVAETVEDARALIADFLAKQAGGFVRVDTSADSGLSPWLASVGLARVDHAVAMVRAPRPCVPSAARLFGLASQSLG